MIPSAAPNAPPAPAPRPRGVLYAGAALCAAGLALVWLPPPGWWVGLASLASGLSALWPPARAWATRRLAGRRGELAAEAAVLALLAAVVSVLLWPALLGDRPVSHDHVVHYLKAWELETRLLPDGRVFGWSPWWFAGQPANYLYPMGGDLWVVAVHGLSFGLLSLSQAYGVAIWLFSLLLGYAAYDFGKRMVSRPVGVLAALLLLTDTGYFRQGGWSFALSWGVWPQSLSVAFALLGLARLPAIVEGDRLRPVAAFGVFMGLAVLCHPLQLHLLLFAIAVVPLSKAWTGGGFAWVAGALRLGAGTFVAALLAATWLLPFLDTQSASGDFGAPWHSGFDLGVATWRGNVFRDTHWLVFGAALLGAVALLRARRWTHLFCGLMVAALVGASASSLVDELHLGAISESFGRIQYERYVILLKPFMFTGAAVVLVNAGRLLRTAEAAPSWAGPARVFAVTFLLAPMLFGLATEVVRAHFVRSLQYASDRPLQKERADLVAWAKTLPDEGFHRWALLGREHGNTLMDLAVDLGAPVYRSGNVPAATYKYKLAAGTPDVLRALNVRYVISSGDQPAPHFKLLKRFGPLRVHRFEGWGPLPFVVDGAGEVQLVRFEDERVELKAGPGARGRLRLNVSAFPRWRATRDGAPIEIRTEPLRGVADSGFMSVALEPGTYRFEFVRSPGDRLALALGAFGLLLAFALALGDTARLRPRSARVHAAAVRLGERWPRVPAVASVALLGAGAAATLALGAWRPRGDLGEVRYDFLESLNDADVVLKKADGKQRGCTPLPDGFICGVENAPRLGPGAAQLEPFSTYRCVITPLPPRGSVRLRYTRVPRGDRLVGHYGVPRGLGTKNTPVTLTIEADGKRVFRGRAARDAHGQAVDVKLLAGARPMQFDLRIDNEGSRPTSLCFDARVLSGGDPRLPVKAPVR